MKFINKIKTYKDLQGQLIPVGTCFLYDDIILKEYNHGENENYDG